MDECYEKYKKYKRGNLTKTKKDNIKKFLSVIENEFESVIITEDGK
jgi:hypothetical protein